MGQVTLGGERLGSGKKQKVNMREYERSTHDLSYPWRSTMASGTLVPFMSEVALPGDTFDIDLNAKVFTHPTIGPLFGQYKLQLDVFKAPIRLYQGKLHMNQLNIGLDMSKVKLPQIRLEVPLIDKNVEDIDNSQINPSCIFSYLDIRGCGYLGVGDTRKSVFRDFNAVPYLAYFDIYKNYYANKQEEIGAIIHNDLQLIEVDITQMTLINIQLVPPGATTINVPETRPGAYTEVGMLENTELYIAFDGIPDEEFDVDRIQIVIQTATENNYGLSKLFKEFIWDFTVGILRCKQPTDWMIAMGSPTYKGIWNFQFNKEPDNANNIEPKVVTFPLTNIDYMREEILTAVRLPEAFVIDASTNIPPYNYPLQYRLSDGGGGGEEPPAGEISASSARSNQEGLLLKTYQSDLFNNWVSTEWIDGDNGINEITAIDTTSGSITINEINLSNKIYNMLNRIAISGGSYDDWLDAVYTHDRHKSQENPMYMGGLSKEVVFQEVISNSASTGEEGEQPLGTLAGRGVLGDKHKGGRITVKVDEPCYIIGIVSLTPRIDYSQGNKWDVNLKTMNDLHKPALDEIGFQDLITDQMAWWDTKVNLDNTLTTKSAGKQPAWINYQTNVPKVRGNFAKQYDQMFMVLNRRYEPDPTKAEPTIKDLTTYIDPTKFNHIFADTRRDAQNFWTQISVGISARRKMSARVIPNL